MSKNKKYLDDDYADIQEHLDGWDRFDKPKDLPLFKEDPTNFTGSNFAGSTPSSSTAAPKYEPLCKHAPQLVVDFKGFKCSVGKKWDCEDFFEDYGVVLNLTGSSARPKHHIEIPMLKKWEGFSKASEVLLDWPDYGVLKFPLEFWEDLIAATKQEGGKMLAFCQGGHGRTGTALACLLIAALGFSADEAKQWIWKNYCGKAIESKAQEAYIATIWRSYCKKNKIENRDKEFKK